MVLRLKILLCICIVFLLLSCTDIERDHPGDPDGVNYIGGYAVSSSNIGSSNNPSSSSVAPSSSSLFVAVPCDNASTGANTVTCGGQTYNTVQIGEQIWMAENLNYDVPDDTTDVCYKNDSSNCTTYGRLYSWATAMGLNSNCNSRNCSGQVQDKHQGICPSDWHIPSDDDWTILINYVESQGGCTGCAATRLKAKSGLWPNNTGTNNHGFSALPGGSGSMGGGFGGGVESGSSCYSNWWSSLDYSSYSDLFAFNRYISNGDDAASRSYTSKGNLLSVRCVKD